MQAKDAHFCVPRAGISGRKNAAAPGDPKGSGTSDALRTHGFCGRVVRNANGSSQSQLDELPTADTTRETRTEIQHKQLPAVLPAQCRVRDGNLVLARGQRGSHLAPRRADVAADITGCDSATPCPPQTLDLTDLRRAEQHQLIAKLRKPDRCTYLCAIALAGGQREISSTVEPGRPRGG